MSDQILTKEHLSDLRMEVELLKRDFSYITQLFNKMDSVINKIEDQQDKISEKTENLVDQRVKCAQEELSDLYNILEKTEKSIHERIKSIEIILLDEIKKVGKDLNDHIKDENALMQKLNRLKYVLLGALAIGVWVVKNFEVIEKIFGK